jgi:acyl-CoA thioester hydrolase
MLANFGAFTGREHHFPAHVFYNHTDAGGIVYYANYLRIAEEARVAMFHLLGEGADGPAHGADFVVRHAEIDYMKPARYGDDLIVASTFGALGRTSIEIEQKIMRAGDIISIIKTTLVYVGLASMKPERVPESIANRIKEASHAQ